MVRSKLVCLSHEANDVYGHHVDVLARVIICSHIEICCYCMSANIVLIMSML